uniref:Uncharacterized protein n=1 Tax=Triticum urartu TaxID=4572 RepID=A0A8R7QGK0_TRIUA
MGSESARPRSRLTESSSSWGQDRRTASIPLAPKVHDPTESLRRFIAAAARAATPWSVTARTERSLRRRRPGPRRCATSASAGSPTLSARRSHLSASLDTEEKRARMAGAAARSGARASRARRRREEASVASQRRHTREQRLRSPEPRSPKTTASSSSGRSEV